MGKFTIIMGLLTAVLYAVVFYTNYLTEITLDTGLTSFLLIWQTIQFLVVTFVERRQAKQ